LRNQHIRAMEQHWRLRGVDLFSDSKRLFRHPNGQAADSPIGAQANKLLSLVKVLGTN